MSLRWIRFENADRETTGYAFVDGDTDLNAYVRALELGLHPNPTDGAAEAHQLSLEAAERIPTSLHDRLLSAQEYEQAVT